MATQQMKVKLIANDGTVIEVLQEVAFQSHTIKEMCENMGYDGDVEMDVSEADGKTLKKVLDYCTVFRGEFKHKGPKESKRIELTPQQQRFLDVSDEFLVEIILAADFLNIPGLLEISTQKMANMIEGKKPHEIRQIYQLPDDMNTEKKTQQQNTWTRPQAGPRHPHQHNSMNHMARPQAGGRQSHLNSQFYRNNQQNQYYNPRQFNHFIPQNPPVMYNQYAHFNQYNHYNNQFNQQYQPNQPNQFVQVNQYVPRQNNRPVIYNQQNQYAPRRNF